MNAGQGRRDPRALILIAIGLLWLIAQTGLVPGTVASGLGFYWPLLLVGLGLDLLGWERPWRIPYTALAAVAVVLGVALFPAPNGVGAITHFDEPVGTATAASIRMTLGAAPTDVRAVGDSASLVTASTQGWRHAVFSVGATDPKRISIEPQAGGSRGPTLTFRPNRWHIGIGTAVPVELTTRVGSGPADLDLRDVDLTTFELDGGSGPAKVVLPDAAARYRVGVRGGSGATSLRVAPGAALDMDLTTASGRTGVTFGQFGAAAVRLRSGSGPVTIDVPTGAAVRVVVTSDGSGPLHLGRFLKRLAGSGDTGVWASGEASAGAPSFLITVERAGSGPITVR